MKSFCTLVLTIGVAFATDDANGKDYLLQLQLVTTENRPGDIEGQPAVTWSIETIATPGRRFYVKTTVGGVQYLMRGKMSQGPKNSLAIEYYLDQAHLQENPPPGRTLQGTTTLSVGVGVTLGGLKNEDDVRGVQERHYVLTAIPFVPVIGFRDVSSGFKVKVVNQEGKPISDATLWLGRYESDVPIVGPVASNQDGIARFSEGREELATLTLFATDSSRELRAAANLDRNRVSGVGYGIEESFRIQLGATNLRRGTSLDGTNELGQSASE